MKKNELHIIERNYELNKLKVQDIFVWPILRQRIYFEIIKGKFNFSSKLRTRNKTQLIKNFFYGLNHILKLKKYDFIFLNNTDKRTLIVDQKKYDIFFDAWADKMGQEKSLFIEWAIDKHFSKKQTYSQNVISDLLFKSCSSIFSFFVKDVEIDKVELEKLKKEYNFDFDVTKELKTKFGEIKFYRFLFKKIKPKAVFLISSFTKTSIVIAAHLESIKVIEAQHGYIGDNHQFYGSQYNFGQLYYPDFLISFGKQEKKSTPKDFIFNEEQILPTGSLYLQDIKNNYINKDIETLVKKYDQVFCVTLQTVKEEVLLKWVSQQAKQNSNWLFILMPKNMKLNYQNYTSIENCILLPNLNVYQVLKYSDFNITIYSTTAVEAPIFNVKTIFYNIGNLSKKYFNIDKMFALLINQNEDIDTENLFKTPKNIEEYFVTDYHANVINTKFEF